MQTVALSPDEGWRAIHERRLVNKRLNKAPMQEVIHKVTGKRVAHWGV